ncbi:polysaccharide deacetylase family protein [Arthrobacter sp. NyZ413]|uniref:polysaccharide deacetylase family protein n=1 Tax=Arthrobacter sp. NyZ413 TaxID=3144669 RepID=UPI003BF9208B
MRTETPRKAEGTQAEVSRRSVLLVAGAATFGTIVAGCAFPTPDTSARPTSPKTQEIPAAKAAAATSPKASAVPTAPVQPSRSDIETRFAAEPPGRWGLDLPGIVTHTGSSAIALTFDACGGAGGSGYDARLIETLRRLRIPATLFLNARWITSNPSLSRELASDSLFEIGNHGLAHVPLSTTGRSAYGIAGTSSVEGVMDEVSGGAAGIAALTGQNTPWLRAGTAFYDETAVQVVVAMGLVPVNFSINSDGGATFPPGTVASQLSSVRAGDIVIGHMNQPGSGTSAGYQEALPAMIDQGLNFTTLSLTAIPAPGHFRRS